MKRRLFSTFALSVLLLNTAVFATGDTRNGSGKRRAANDLVALLPASDGVATIDVKRAVSDAMPRILGANQKMLGHVNAMMVELRSKTGIDIKRFDSAAAGIGFRATETKKLEMEPVMIARGDVDAWTLLNSARTASKQTVREEQIAGQTVYVISPKDIADNGGTVGAAAKVTGAVDGLDGDMAVTALDKNTIVFGTIARVRQTLERQTTVSPDIVELLSNSETSVMTFALRTPGGMRSLLPLENDEIGTMVDSIRYMAGSMDMTASGASMSVMARMQQPQAAQKMSETLDGLRVLGKAFLGNAKRADQRIYARLIDNTKIGLRGNDVTLDLAIAQADIDTLIGGIK